MATYGDVAQAAGRPGSARRAARALQGAGAARIPWQRVVGARGRILLPGEAGLHQRFLLEMEGVVFSGGCVRMKKCRMRPCARRKTEGHDLREDTHAQ